MMSAGHDLPLEMEHHQDAAFLVFRQVVQHLSLTALAQRWSAIG